MRKLILAAALAFPCVAQFSSIPSGTGGLSSVSTTCGVTGGPITVSGTITAKETIDSQTGAGAYAIPNSDCGATINRNQAGAVSDTIAQAGGGGNFPTGWYVDYQCAGAGGCTITPATSSIDGVNSVTLGQNQSIRIISNGTNYITNRGTGISYPGSGIPLSTGSGWGTSYSTSGTGSVCLTTNCSMTTPALGTPSALTLTNATSLPIGNAAATTGQLLTSRGGTGVNNTATLTLGTSNINWATLGTGIVKNTTTTGAKSVAVASDVIGLWSGTCNSGSFLSGAGTCLAGITAYPGAGIANSTGSAWGTSYTTSGTGSVCLTASCIMTTPNIGAATGTSLAVTAGPVQVGTGATVCGTTTGGCFGAGEGNSALTAPALNQDAFVADATAHRWLMTNNNAALVNVVGSGADINTSDQVVQIHETGTNVCNSVDCVNTTPYAIVATDSVIDCDATRGNVAITLPLATGTLRQISFKKTDSTSNTCTLNRSGSDMIDNGTSIVISAQNATARVRDDSSALWYRMHVTQLAGDVTGLSTNNTVKSLNGTLLSGLASGLLYNTTTTGVPSVVTGMTSTALATATAANSVQTPSATSTLDSSGNMNLAGNLVVAASKGVGSADTGSPAWTFSTNKATLFGTNSPITAQLGVSGSIVGRLSFVNATSGSIFLTPVSGALSSGTINVPNATGTLTVSATSPLAVDAAGNATCTGCVTSSSPGVGIAHFAGSTQAVTSSAVNLAGGSNEVTGTMAAAQEPAHTGDVTNSAGSLATTVVKVTGTLSSYNGINTVGNGISVLYAKDDKTAQAGNIGSTTILATAAAGMYKLTCYTVSTNAATGGTLPACNVAFTDGDTGTVELLAVSATAATSAIGTVTSSTKPIHIQASTNVGYSTSGYAAGSGTALQYAIHVYLEYMGT